uniref:Uncharacterized protein n=1 Tax=Plectus sambesii TaxID=2011161 RepID=A0A914VRU4_9BILA
MPANIDQDGKMSDGKVTNDKVSDANRSELKLYYRANQIPSPPTAILFGFQQLMVCVSGLLVTPYILSNTACAGAATALIRVRLISTTLVVAGLSTLLQNTLGVSERGSCPVARDTYDILPATVEILCQKYQNQFYVTKPHSTELIRFLSEVADVVVTR